MNVSEDMAKVIDVTEEIGVHEPGAEEVIEECYESIRKMTVDRDAKMKAAKEQLVEMLKVTADKYRTGTGVMEALRVLRMVSDGKPADMEVFDEIQYARDIAAKMVVEVSKLTERAESLGWHEMDELLDGAYDENFIEEEFSAVELAFELMRLDLCRNVGPAAEDMVEFGKRVDEELDKVREQIELLEE